tara:strand:+ start:2871 stop:3536 length:666 start_codon:yes stop_codon:yes gene_type:complete
MIISHKHKFIFIHIPKSAGTSVFLSLANSINALDKDEECICSIDDHILVKSRDLSIYGNSELCDDFDLWQHSKLFDIEALFKLKGWNIDEYFKFAFVRNPWARAVSYWAYQFADQNFEDFCMGSDDVQYRYIKKDTNKVLNKYGKYYYESEIGIDFVGRLENLSEDLKLACDKIGIPNPEMHHHNKSDHKHYTEYYNEKTQEIIAKNYELDTSKFGYTFTS